MSRKTAAIISFCSNLLLVVLVVYSVARFFSASGDGNMEVTGALCFRYFTIDSNILAANNWNVVQYSVLTMMMAQVAGLEPGEFVHVIADAHIYDRHIPAIEELIKNEPKPAPKFILDPSVDDFYKFTRDSFRVENYEYSEFTGKIPVAV